MTGMQIWFWLVVWGWACVIMGMLTGENDSPTFLLPQILLTVFLITAAILMVVWP